MRFTTRLQTGWRRHLLLAAAVSAAALLLAACGDDSGSGGIDSAYVKAVCEAAVEMEEDMVGLVGKAMAGELADEEARMKAFVEVSEGFLDGLEDASPPSDMRTTHDAMFESISKVMRSGDPAALVVGDPLGDLPEPPPAVEERLSRAAEDEPACQESELF